MATTDYRLEAYRIISDNLTRIRAVLREALLQLHGPGWEAVVEPADRRTYLAQRREREISINWRRATMDDLLQYGNFSDLYEFAAADRRLLQRFATLASNEEVLRLRFLEVDAIFNRVAYARSISDSEMELLISFDERLRRLLEGPPAGEAAVEVPLAAPPTTPTAKVSPPPPEPPAGQGPEVTPKAQQSSPPAPQPLQPPEPRAADAAPRPPAAPAGPPGSTPPPAMISPSRLRDALQTGDDATVLAGLYGEVTAIADGLWSDNSCPSPRLWELVRESPWYSENFTTLRLKPVSDFYDLANSARERLLEGISRKQLQDFLKEHNFAQILLALRDLFRAHLPGAATN